MKNNKLSDNETVRTGIRITKHARRATISIDDDEYSLHHSTMLAAPGIDANQPDSASPASPNPDVAAAAMRRGRYHRP